MNLIRHAFTAPHYLQTPTDDMIRWAVALFAVLALAAVCAIVAGRASR